MMVLDGQSFTLDEAQPIARQVHRHLRERIIRNDLQPGNRISEAEIARGFNVSRQPVREAFIKLSEQGLLAVLPQRGTIISKIDYIAVLDARFLREAIEADFVAILASAPDPALIAELRAQIAVHRLIGPDRPASFIQQDELFHRTLAEAAGKGGAWKLLEGLKSQMDRVRFLSLGHFPMVKLVNQHEALVDGIERGDMPCAQSAIRLHLREILHDLPQIRAARPEFFDVPDGPLPQPVDVPIQGGETR